MFRLLVSQALSVLPVQRGAMFPAPVSSVVKQQPWCLGCAVSSRCKIYDEKNLLL